MISRRKVMIQAVTMYVPKLVTWGVGYFAFTSVLRLAGPAAYAEYVLVNSYWTFLAVFSGSMMGGASQKLLAEGQVLGEGDSRLLLSLRFVLIVLFGLAVVGLAGALPFGHFVLKSDLLRNNLAIGLLLFAGLTLQNYFRFALRSLQMIRTLVVMDSVESLLRNLFWLSAAGVFYFGIQSLITGAALAVMGASASAIAGVLLVRHARRNQAKPASVNVRKTLSVLAKDFAIILTCNYVIFALPSFIINYFQPKEVVGAYAAIFRVADMINGPVTVLGTILAPLTSGAALTDEAMLQKILKRSFQVSIFTFPMLFLVFLNRDVVINILGLREIPHADETLAAFCVFILFAGFSALFGNYADYLGYTARRSKLMIFFAIAYTAVMICTSKWGNISHIALGSTLVFSAMISCYFLLIGENHGWHFALDNRGLFLITMGVMAVATVPVLVFSQSIGSSDLVPNLLELVRRSAIFVFAFAPLFMLAQKIRRGRWLGL